MSGHYQKEEIRNQILELEKICPKNPREFAKREEKLDSLYAQLYQLNRSPQA